MEYAKDNAFNKINYNNSKIQIKKESWTSKFVNNFKKHKFISIALSLFFMFSCINFSLIYYFMTLFFIF